MCPVILVNAAPERSRHGADHHDSHRQRSTQPFQDVSGEGAVPPAQGE